MDARPQQGARERLADGHVGVQQLRPRAGLCGHGVRDGAHEAEPHRDHRAREHDDRHGGGYDCALHELDSKLERDS